MPSEPDSSSKTPHPVDFDFLKGPSAPKLKSTVAPSEEAKKRSFTRPAGAPAAAEPAASAAPADKPQSKTMPTPQNIEDFRRNAERQSREQQSFGNVLATVTYSILIAFILVTGLAAYGEYILFGRVKAQSQSLVAINKRYDAEVIGLKEDLTRSHAEVQRLSDDVERQQEELTRLRAVADRLAADLASDHKDLQSLRGRSSSSSSSVSHQ